MASSGKKKGKTVWKPAGQGEVISISSARNCSWADEVENEVEDSYDTKPVVLPTAPRASCMVVFDESKVPNSPPFQAHVSNLPYELTEEELVALFPDSNVKDVKIPKDDRGGNRAKGFGYVVFEDRGSLITALHMSEVFTKGRSVRIELATSDSGRGGGRGRGPQRNDSGSMNSSSIDRTAGNWRSGPRDEVEDRDRDRGYDRGGPRREYNQGSFSRRENDGFQERRDRDDRYGKDPGYESRLKYEDRPRPRDDSSRSYKRDDRPREDPPLRTEPSSNEPKNRPKLNLKPRSTDLPPPAATVDMGASTSIFGSAKPVDTSAKLREIEERLAKSEMMGEKSRSAGSSTGSSSGAPRSSSDVKERKMEPAQVPKENAWNKPWPVQQAPRASRSEEQKDI